jgi:pimeloyl-ACP methyl ester carboxylesterase
VRASVGPTPVRITRRRFLKGGLGLAATAPLALTACEDLIRVLAEACPEDPAESGGVTWTPDVMHPVFYGFQDLSEADGAPAKLRIFYPTYEGFNPGPPILKLCLVRYPVVLFLHGQPPSQCPSTDYHKRWFAIPAVLARSGYVVAVPSYSATLPDTAESPNASLMLELLDWIRTGWNERKWVNKQAESTAVAGHSYGGLLAARLVGLRSTIAALVTLGAPWDELHDPNVLNGLTLPKFLMWGRDLFFEDLEQSWGGIPAPKHGVVYEGEHFDYLPERPDCPARRGPCGALEFGTADLIALFLARYLPVQPQGTTIPVTLEPPFTPLTQEQQFYAGGRLGGLDGLQASDDCQVELRWEDAGSMGSRNLAA